MILRDLGNLSRRYELLLMLVWRDIRIRYKQTVMGFLWAVLMPSVIVGAGAIVRLAVARYTNAAVNINDIHSVMVRAVAWSFVLSGIRFGTGSLLANVSLVTKLAFPKEVFPIAAILSSLFDFSVATVAIGVVLLATGWGPTMGVLWTVPLLIVLIALTTGLALFLSAANLFFRDVKYLVEIFLTYAIFFTPVLYDVSMLGKWGDYALLNPIAPILEGLSAAVVFHGQPDLAWVGYSAICSLLLLTAGYWIFKQAEAKFAENI